MSTTCHSSCNPRHRLTTRLTAAFSSSPSLPSLLAECLEPPYQVTESGWGEFDIGIKIVLRDPEAEPISLTHKLRFHQPPGVPTTVEVPRVAEAYDEVVFNELPRDAAAAAALAGGPTKPQPPYLWQEWFQMFSSESDLVKVQAARQYIQDRRVELEERLLRAQTEMARTRDELEVLGVL